MSQLGLFVESTGLFCSFGRPWPVDPTGPGPHHCEHCNAVVVEAHRAMEPQRHRPVLEWMSPEDYAKRNRCEG